jgi:predicted AlkP superfamily phosphohydrolase/phosphomutase/Flp pilus assembly protein TadD
MPFTVRSPRRSEAAGVSILASLLLLAACGRSRLPAAPRSGAIQQRPRVENLDPPRQARLVTPRGRPRVILVGLDGADWSLLDRLAAAGRMPNLARLTREGRSAFLTSFVPILSPVVWTSIATGATPDRHGVLDFQEVDPKIGSAVPISGRSRRIPAVWNLASARGMRVGIVGWWATDPAEVVNGFFVSDRASSILFEGSKESLAYPPSLSDGVRRVMEAETRVSDADLTPYLAMTAQEIAAERGKGLGLENPVSALAKILGATRAVQRIARDLYDREAPDFTAVYFEGTDAIGHVFAADVPPRLACVSDEDSRRYSGTVDAYYALVDRLLGQWMRRAQEDGATLVLCSDHGFKWGEERTCQRSSLNWATAAFWHRLEGVLALWGARVKPPGSRGKASVYDIAPTVCALLGMPVDPQMSGRALVEQFDDVPAPPRQSLFANIVVARLPASAPSASERDEYERKLRALGYLAGSPSQTFPVPSEGPWPGRTEGAWNNLGLFQREAGRLDEAERSFHEALRIKPGYASPMFNLAVLERTRGRWVEARDCLFRSLDAGHPEPEQTLLQWVSAAVRARQRGQAVLLLEAGVTRYPHSEPLALALGRMRFEAKDCRRALSGLSGFAETGGRDTLNLLGVSELCLGDSESARRYFDRSLSIDPVQPRIREALRLIEGGSKRSRDRAPRKQTGRGVVRILLSSPKRGLPEPPLPKPSRLGDRAAGRRFRPPSS